MPKHVKLTSVEECILTSIVALAQQLQLPLEDYTAHIGRIRTQKFGVKGRGRGERPSIPERHRVRVTE